MSEAIVATCRALACDGKPAILSPMEHNPKHDHAIIGIVVALEPQHGHDHLAGAAGKNLG